MKILKNRKALSPVVASIILIAVTVAVSIAVAAWMGALTFTFTSTEQLQITDLEFIIGANNTRYIYARVRNTGTSPVTLTSTAYVNGQATTITNSTLTVSANSGAVFVIPYQWDYGNTYEVRLQSTKGNAFLRTETAPTK
jgi:flagellin-like protein